jgi:hypothetical protein
VASGIVSTFHEFGATLGAALVSSVAVAGINGVGSAGFSTGFWTAAVVAVVFGILVAIVGPRR